MSLNEAAAFLASMDLPSRDLDDLPTSEKRFPDGAQFRIEIPSTEGPASLCAVLDEADRRDVPVHRVSQGSGVLLLTDAELDEMAAVAADAAVEVSLSARPHAAWGTSAMARTAAGGGVGSSARGQAQLVYQLEDARRAAAHGFRSVLVTDIGTLSVFDLMRRGGVLPASMQAKVSVLLPVANAASARVVAQLGASTLNVPTDLTLGQIAAIRAAIDAPLDVYIESADEFGGFIRYNELADLIRVAAPVYLKLGLRNAADVYPAGSHLESTVVALSRERVRRAEIALEMIGRTFPDAVISERGAEGLALIESGFAAASPQDGRPLIS
jgi:hypothetical protein